MGTKMEYKNFLIDKIVAESSTIKSFYLKPDDGSEPKNYLPGQFVSVKVKPTGFAETIVRNYTLSDSPNKSYFRLTIKREENGVVSRYFHDEIEVGDLIEVSHPAGQFYLKNNDAKPVVFLSGGVGITPMLSMIEEIVATKSSREVFFLHSSLNKSVQPMLSRLKEISKIQENFYLSIFHTEPTSDEIEGVDYDFKGFITQNDLETWLPKIDSDYYLCGPEDFMQTMFGYLINLGVSADRIYYEFFGEAKKLGATTQNTSNGAYRVKFAKSNIEIDWCEDNYSILELAENSGLKPDYRCRMGTCETCELNLLSGSVEYDPEPSFEVSEGKVLICCAKPKTDIEVDL